MSLIENLFPFLMAIVTNSIMIVMIYFLRKSPYFANLFGIWSMMALYLLCVLRMVLPFEIPGIQVVIRDNAVYNTVIDSLIERRSPSVPSTLFYILIGVWISVALIIGMISISKQRTFRRYVLANSDVANDPERALLRTVADEIRGTDRKVNLIKSDAVGRIMVIGFFKKYILLPDRECDPAQLEMILRHECTHIRNKDLWIKLLIQLYCCIFWWNPFAYLLKHDLAYSLEMKCDLSVIRGLSSENVLVYLNTIHSTADAQTETAKQRRSPFLVSAELTDTRKSRELVKRVKAITADQPKKAVVVTVSALTVLVMLAVFVLSYVYIVQPFYGPDVESIDYGLNDSAVVVDESNGYLKRQEDGTYLFYYSDFPPVPVTDEEMEQGLYDYYPILDN